MDKSFLVIFERLIILRLLKEQLTTKLLSMSNLISNSKINKITNGRFDQKITIVERQKIDADIYKLFLIQTSEFNKIEKYFKFNEISYFEFKSFDSKLEKKELLLKLCSNLELCKKLFIDPIQSLVSP